VQDYRIHRGADFGSDHYLTTTTVLNITLTSRDKMATNEVLDIGKLWQSEIQQHFNLELASHFSLLEVKESETDTSVEEEWTTIRNAVQDTAQKVIGF